jgi:hypothetical protein
MHSNVVPGTAGTTAGQTTLAWIPRLASRVCSMDSAVRKVSTFVVAPVALASPLALDGDSCEGVVREVPPHPTVATASAAAYMNEARRLLVGIYRAYPLHRAFLRRRPLAVGFCRGDACRMATPVGIEAHAAPKTQARPGRFERPTSRSGGERSIH